MGAFWRENVIDAGKLPLLLLTISFMVTFVITRVIVRMIRAGKGPFSDNSVGGVHVHHMVPGLVLMVLGGITAVGTVDRGWQAVAGVVFGAGLALVMDEFSLVLHLQDVYWEQQGRTSVDVVFLIGGLLMLLLVVGSPFGVDTTAVDDAGVRWAFTLAFVMNLGFAALAALKGKFGAAAAGLLFPIVAYIAAIRVARPKSAWAHRRYATRPHKAAKAERREVRFNARWRSKIFRLQDLVAGTGGPSDPDPDAPPGSGTSSGPGSGARPDAVSSAASTTTR